MAIKWRGSEREREEDGGNFNFKSKPIPNQVLVLASGVKLPEAEKDEKRGGYLVFVWRVTT